VDSKGRLGGQFVQNAKVYIDGSDVDARDVVAMPTNASGATAFQITARKAGTVDICLVAEDRYGEALYGAAQLRAVDRSQNRFLTISGRDMARAANGSWFETDLPGPEYVRGAQAPDHFSQLVSSIQNLLTGFSGQVANVFKAQAPARNKLVTATKRLGFSPGQFAFGQTVGPTTRVVDITRNTGLVGQAGSNIISDKGMGVISAEGGNAIAAGGGNLIGDNGSALIGQAGTNFGIPTGAGGGLAGVVNVARAQIVDIGGHKIISDNGLGVVAPTTNAICAGGYN
jgi:hypothetical protein